MAETAVVDAVAETVEPEQVVADQDPDADIVEGADEIDDGIIRVGQAVLLYFDWREQRSATRQKRGLDPEPLTREARVAVARFVSHVTPQVPIADLTPHQMTAYQDLIGANTTQMFDRLMPVKDFLRFCWKERSLTATNLGNNIRLRRPDQKRWQELKEMKAKFVELQEKMPQAAQAVAEARENKDSLGDAPLEAAREDQKQLKGRIDELKGRIDELEYQLSPSHEAGVRFDVTQEGLDKMKADLAQLHEEMPLAVQAVAQAREDKDIRENAPLEAAREYQERLKGRIDELEYQIAHAVVTSAVATGRAHVGSTVKVALLDREPERIEEYTLVGPTEVDVVARRISIESPMGRGLVDKAVDSEVEIKAPRGTIRFRVVSVEG